MPTKYDDPRNVKGETRQAITKQWNALRDEAYKIADEHGFHESQRTFDEIACLFHSELSEALEELRKGDGHEHYYAESGKPEGFYVEVADCIIRCLDYLGDVKWIAAPYWPTFEVTKENRISTLAKAHIDICEAQKWKFEDKSRCAWIQSVIGICCALLEAEGQDPVALIVEKMDFNKGREKLHGKKF